MKMNNVDILSYNELLNKCTKSEIFDEAIIRIIYTKNIFDNGNGSRLYKIIRLECDYSEDEDRNKNLKKFIKNCNDSIQNNKYPNDWQIFYLYKELFQLLINDQVKYNYFRGQSGSDDPLPGILRNSVPNSYRANFENLYRKISKEFPDKIEYVELKDNSRIEDRENQLSLLQHYGLKTSLLDITSNPYIALLFMLSRKFDEYKEPSLFLFRINENYDDEDYLFTEVRKDKINERIIAQKGAFLNFDKLCFNREIQKIPSVKIILKFSSEELLKEIDLDSSKLKEMESEIDISTGKEEDVLIIEKKSDYLKILETEKRQVEASKIDCLNFINEELIKKLREYYYFEEDLFPDFEKRIQYFSKKYQTETTKKVISDEIKNRL